MKICVYGAGAIGAYLGAQLASAGADVSFVARGPHLAAMQLKGVRLPMAASAPSRSGVHPIHANSACRTTSSSR
jgi:ketopantoate reductase